MRLSYLAYSFSLIFMYFSVMLFLPIIVALFYHETSSIFPFLIAGVTALMASITIKKVVPNVSCVKSINDIKKSEGLCVVTFSWICAGLFASIPYLFYGLSPIDALFEATSGITTTGATIFTHFNYSHALFFWRSFTQWLGGMGIIVLFIAVLPQFAIAGRQMFSAEAPGPTEEKFTPRIRNTAAALWKVYAGLTILEFVLLIICGMDGFEAVCHSLSSVSGGGLSPNYDSFIRYSYNIMWIVTLFMFFAGVSFNLQYQVWTKFNPFLLFKNEEFRVYFGIGTTIALCLAGSLYIHQHYNILDSLTHAFFNVSSLISTTGYCSVDFAKWDYASKLFLLVIMLSGSCASSAGGGLKIMRWLLIFKIMKIEMTKILHPKAVFNLKIGNHTVSKDVMYQILMFVFFYISILVISAFLIAMLEKNTTLAITGAISSMGNIGPGMGQIIGPLGSFEPLKAATKLILIIDMYIGRLELIPFLVLFQNDLWCIKK